MAESKVRKLFGIEIMKEVLSGVQFMSMIYGAQLNSVTAFWVWTYLIQFPFFLVQFFFSEFMHEYFYW